MRTEGDITPVGTIISEKLAYDNPFFPVVERVIEDNNGDTRDPQFLWDRGSRKFAIALATTHRREIVLVREPKYGQMDLFTSLPTGGVKKDEPELEAARREFLEETGYQAKYWEPFKINSNPIISFADKIDGGEHNLYYGWGADKVGEPEKFQEVLLFKPIQLREAILSGDLKIPAISIAAIFIGLAYLK